MSTYRVNWTLDHDGERYEAGAEIELTDDVAATLGDVVSKLKAAPTRKTSKSKSKADDSESDE